MFNQIGDELKLELNEKKLVHNGIYKEEIFSKLNDEHLKVYKRIILFSKIRRGSMLLLIIFSILIIFLDIVIE